MIWEEGVINAPPRSPTPAARTVSSLMDHQLEPVIRTLQAARLRDQEPMFWSMQGSICKRGATLEAANRPIGSMLKHSHVLFSFFQNRPSLQIL